MGYAIATFAVTVNTLIALKNKGLLTDSETHEVMRRARTLLAGDGPAGMPGAIGVAQECLKQAEQLFHAATAPKPAGGRH